jgi:hypothetical protein
MLEFSDLKEMPKALVKMQKELENPVKNKQVKMSLKSGRSVSYGYVELDELLQLTKEIIAENDFSVVQSPYDDAEKFGIETMLIHSSGEFIKGRFSKKISGGESAQDLGGIITYFRRYHILSMLNLAQEDDDAIRASGNKQVSNAASDKQKKFLHTLIIEKNVNLTEELIAKLKTINGKQCSDAIKALQAHNISEFNKIVAR